MCIRDRDNKNKAIADFERITVPSILAMAPYISKPPAERAAAFPNHGTIFKACDDAAGTAYQGKEPLANDVSNICQSLALWMNNQDALTCRFIKWADDTEALTKVNDESILRTYRASNAKKILQDLELAVGCKTKDKAYWANRTISSYQNMTKIISPDPATRINISPEALEIIDDDCFSSYVLSDGYSKVSKVARAGCFAIYKYGKGGAHEPCTSWLEARRDSETIKETEPLYGELLWLRLSFLEFSGKTNCDAKVRELFAQEQAAAEQAQAAAAQAQAAEQARRSQENRSNAIAAVTRYKNATAARESKFEELKATHNSEWYKKLEGDMRFFPSLASRLAQVDCDLYTELYEIQTKVLEHAAAIRQYQPSDDIIKNYYEEENLLNTFRSRQNGECELLE